MNTTASVLAGAVAALAVLASDSYASLIQWDFDRPSQDYIDAHTVGPNRYTTSDAHVNESAGLINSITGTYDADAQQFGWSVTFGGQPDGHTYHTTQGFWLVVTPGKGALGTSGEMAHLIFDGSGDDPTLTGYAYNGLGDESSYNDGSIESGVQSPDTLLSSINDPGSIISLAMTQNPDDTTTMSFIIDASAITGHSPLYPGDGPWTGVEFGDLIGVWMHPLTNIDSSYDGGYLTDFGYARHGWYSSEQEVVPTPGAAALLVLAAIIPGGRRRRR